MTQLTPVLSRFWDEPEPWSLDTYRRHDGYRALERALGMDPDGVIALVKDSGLRGRGGAGFPTGTKWSFIPQGDTGAGAKPHYLVINADESEPGTCKDIPLMLTTPHFLVEGAIVAAYAIRAHHAFIYVRGEVVPVLRRLQTAVAEAYDAGYLGKDIRGTGFDLELIVHAGAGAYICGEETALLDSLEGRGGRSVCLPDRGQQRGIHCQRASDLAQRRRLVPGDGLREIARVHAVFAIRTRQHARTVRSTARHHPARTIGVCGRGAGRTLTEILDTRWFVNPSAD